MSCKESSVMGGSEDEDAALDELRTKRLAARVFALLAIGALIGATVGWYADHKPYEAIFLCAIGVVCALGSALLFRNLRHTAKKKEQPTS